MGGGPGGGGGGGGMGGAIMDEEDNPIWVDSTVSFNGETWEHVGFRLKGNSSLRSSWTSGNYKLPFRLDFDQFEDDYPATHNQCFYGFKKLTFSSNFSDSSYLRETVAADIFRAAGVPAAHTAFYSVYIDYGDGPVYFGLYTAVEAVDDTLIQTQFTNDSGNVYKPSGSAATFKAGTFNEEQYAKKTNEKDADYSDVKALMETLNDSSRQTDPEKWRSNLEKVFDVDDFLKWLAANSIMSNWDTYGSMAHNYYLYHDPTSGELVWIPWDNNQSISSRGNGGGGGKGDNGGGNANNGGNNVNGGGGGGPMGQSSSSIGNESTGDSWPLISYLMADEVYHAQYIKTVNEVLNSAFDLDSLDKEITAKHDLIASYVESEKDGYTTLSDKSSFETSAQALIETLSTRYQLAQEYLTENQ
jgi:spore coat protein CotH